MLPEIDIESLEPAAISCDRLTPSWEIFQLKKGHRFSADDIFTAYFAAKNTAPPQHILDLGAGIGTVGLLTLSRFPSAVLTMIEAQQISHQLARRTIAHNRLDDRVHAIRGDLRDHTLAPAASFDLITGSPPYIPMSKGVCSPHPQRAACRMEQRGNIFDYAKAAYHYLKPMGTFVICFAAGDPRGEEALLEAGFFISLRQNVIFRAGHAPTIAIFIAQKQQTHRADAPPIYIRDETGQWTDTYQRVREFR